MRHPEDEPIVAASFHEVSAKDEGSAPLRFRIESAHTHEHEISMAFKSKRSRPFAFPPNIEGRQTYAGSAQA